MRTAQDVLATAGELADEVLFPDAMRVDRLDVLPAAHLDALAAAGLYGAPAPADAGGLGLDPVQVANVVEELAGGCLAAAFVLTSGRPWCVSPATRICPTSGAMAWTELGTGKRPISGSPASARRA